ncbi:mucin-binding protein [Lactobacillus intestinalis]|nr:MucBP domain-containing protein [Lactobacillus intestinalis]
MSSKRNSDLEKNLADEKQRFGIRKFSVGVASVLLGTSLMFGAGSQIAHADTNSDGNGSGDANSTDTSASDVQRHNEQATSNNYTTQSEINKTSNDKSSTGDKKATPENKSTLTQEINNKKTESLEKKAPSVGSTTTDSKEESKTPLENKTDKSKVEKTTPPEVKSESHEDLTSDKKGTKTQEIQTQTLKLASATPLSAKALTESKAQNQDTVTANVNLIDDDTNFGTGDTITTKTYTLNSGATVTDLINQIKKDLDSVTEDYYGPDPKLDSTAGGRPAYTPVATGTYKHAPIATLDDKTRLFNLDPSTLKDKPTLAGYTITTDNNDNLHAAITNNATYNINLIHRMSVLQDKYFYKAYTRQITYKMYGLDDQSIAPTTVTQYAVAQAQNGKNYNRINPATNHNEVNIADVVYSWDMATGAQNNLTTFSINWRGLILVFDGQKSPVATDGSEYSQLAGWVPDKDVDPTGNSQRTGYSLWQNAPGLFYKNKHVDAVQDETVTYYHNQPVDLSFEDISTVAPQDLSGNNYEASNELTYDNTASNQYDVYGALNKDGKNLSDVIKSIEDKGYKLVSITNDDDASQKDLKDNSQINLTYDKDGVWKNDQLVHKAYTIKFVHDVKPTTETTSVSRNIHYVADEGNSKYEVLKDPDTQTVNFERTAYIDQVTKQEVIKNADGTYSELPADFKKVWKAVGTDTFAQIQKDRFNKDEGKVTGVWIIERANYDDPEGTQLKSNFAPEVANVSAQKYNDIYLVYNKATAGYNIHYIDVSDSNKTSNFDPNDGNEFLSHEVKDVHGDVGDTPNATSKLWGEHNDSDSGYGDLGYVAVGLSTNAEDGKLANQELVEDVQDQYVYLKHKAVEITSKTPNPPKNSSVDPQDLSKSADRIIHYVTEKDKTPLLDDTTQKITFEGTAYVDVVNGKNVQTVEGTDAITGQKVLIALTTPGTITWTATAGDGSTVDNNKGSFNQVTKPVITDGKVAGTWTVTDGTANNAKQDGTDLDPASKNFDPHREVTLEYTKDVNADIIYIDDTDNKVLIPTANDTDEHGKPGQDVHFAQDPQKTIADFENQGYVLVRDDFGNGQKYGDTDSHYEIHFVHGVDKNVEHKSSVRIIHYVTDDGDQVLLDPTTQDKVSFAKTTYTDRITHKTVGLKEVKDANGNTVQVSDNTDTTPAWVVDGKDSFDQVTKPVITDGKLAGKWLVTEATANNAPEFKVPDPSDPNFKEVYDVTLKYVQNVNADITYWDITYGMNRKIKLGDTDPASDDKGRTGELIHFNNNEKRISDLENEGYVFVDTDYHNGDKYGKEDSHFNVYLRHAVKDITPNTPVEDVPKDPDGNPTIDPKSLHKEFTRTITFVANNDAKSPLKDSIPQKVEFDGHIYVDMVTGQTTTPETVKDANGKTTQVATTKAGNIEWNHDTQTMDEVVQKYITLNKGDKYATSDDMVGTWHWISGVANEITLKPTSDNPEDLELVYEKNKGESGPSTDYDLPNVDVKEETKTFTRTVVYRGTKDGGVHFESVNGSPDGKNIYKQTVTFTRNILRATDKDGKVTILETTPWTAKDDTLSEVVSKTPSAVGYEVVDIEKVDAHKIDPDKDPENLGETIVTYSMKPKHETGPSTDYDLPNVDVKEETKTFTRTVVYRGTKDGGQTYEDVNGSPDGKNTYKQTVTFTRNIFSTTDKDGKVIILETTPWKTQDSMGQVDSKKPSDVGYDKVDIESVSAITVDPNSDKTDLGTTVVTYTISSVTPPVENTYHVTVHYVDEDGNVIKDPVKDPADFKNGESYDENSKKDSTIEHDGKTYEFTRVKEGDSPAGTIQGKDVDVTYVYKLKKNPVTPVVPPVEETYHVTVHYVDEEGNVIKDPVKDPADFKNGESYDENNRKDSTIKHDGKTYEFTRVKEGDVPAGTIQGKDVDVTYVYKLKETPVTPPSENTYNVTVNFVDEHGNVLQDPRHSSDHKNGTDYNESDHPTTITKGGKTYTYIRVEDDKPTGTINGRDVVITYVYKEVETPTEPTNPSTPSEPTAPTEPTNPTQPSTPSEPSTPTTPSEPDTPSTPDETPDEPATPSKPAKKTNFDNDVAPSHESYTDTNKAKFENVNAKKKSTSTNAALAEDTIAAHKTPKYRRSAVPQSDRILPQTGQKKTSESAIVGLAALALSGIISLAIDRKKKN